MNQHAIEQHQRTDLESLIQIAKGKQVDEMAVRFYWGSFLAHDPQEAYERTLEYIDQRERANRKWEDDYR